MDKVRFGIIGADFDLRANMVLANYPKDRGELVALCDLNPEMFEKFKVKYPEMSNVSCYTKLDEFLSRKDMDAVFIMVRDNFHEELAVAALEAGKAVYLEKPMAITVEGCDRILETAMRTGSKIFLGHNMRYFDSVLKMKEIIDSGIIGNIQCVWVRHFINYGSCYYHHWCAEQKNCNGLLLQKGAHDIDVIHWLTGAYSERVVGMGRLSVYNRTTNRLKEGEAPDRKKAFQNENWPPLSIDKLNPNMDVEDHNMLLMQLSNGIQASYEHCMYAPDSERNYTFIGDRGRVENIGDIGDCEIHVWTSRTQRATPDIIHKIKARSGSHGGSDAKIVEAFFDYIQYNKRPNVSPIAARYAVAAGVMGHISMRNGNIPQDIPALPPEVLEYFSEK